MNNVTNPCFGRKIPLFLGRKSKVVGFVPTPLGTKPMNMDSALRVSKGYGSQVKYAVLMPLFFFVFIFVYNPFSFETFYTVGGKSYAFHLLMLTVITAGVYALTRLVFSFLYKHIPFLWWHYAVWCLGEVLIVSFFQALYTALFYNTAGGMPYFSALTYCFELTAMILVYPYLISILLRLLINKDADLKNGLASPEESLVKFHDYHKRLKLTIAPSAVIYVSAEANYVSVHYLENDKVKTFLLRNSMKSVEVTASKHGLVRCHRSYFVNPAHIKVLSRDKDGIIYTEFTHEGIGRIPVSKQYYDNLAELL